MYFDRLPAKFTHPVHEDRQIPTHPINMPNYDHDMVRLGHSQHSNEGRQHLHNQVKLATYRWVFIIKYSHKWAYSSRPIKTITTHLWTNWRRLIDSSASTFPCQARKHRVIKYSRAPREQPLSSFFPCPVSERREGQLYVAQWVIFSPRGGFVFLEWVCCSITGVPTFPSGDICYRVKIY